MTFQLEDGRGSGRRAEVDEHHGLRVSSSMELVIERQCLETGKVWHHCVDAVTTSGANWCLYFGNGGQATYAISKMILKTDVAGVIRVARVSGTPAGGTTVVPSHMNFGKRPPQDATTSLVGANITGLTEEALIGPIHLPAGQPVVIEVLARIFVTPGTAIAVKAPAAITLNGLFQVYEV